MPDCFRIVHLARARRIRVARPRWGVRGCTDSGTAPPDWEGRPSMSNRPGTWENLFPCTLEKTGNIAGATNATSRRPPPCAHSCACRAPSQYLTRASPGTWAAPERPHGPSCALPQHAPSRVRLVGLGGAGREAGSRADPQRLQGAGAPHAAIAAYDSSTCCQKTMADTVMTMITAGVKRSQMMGRASRRSENFRT